MEFLQVLLMLVAVVLIILSLLQGGKSDGLSSAFTGAGDLNLFANTKERGAKKTQHTVVKIQIFYKYLLLFFFLVVLIRVLS